jgi:hypothetical protein
MEFDDLTTPTEKGRLNKEGIRPITSRREEPCEFRRHNYVDMRKYGETRTSHLGHPGTARKLVQLVPWLSSGGGQRKVPGFFMSHDETAVQMCER